MSVRLLRATTVPAVQFNIYNDLSQATSALTETSDVTAVALGDNTVTVTLAEYGNAVITTAKLRGTSFLNVDADAANIIGYNMVDSIDKVVSDVANGGTNVAYGGSAGSRAAVAAGDIITADKARAAVADLRTASAPGFETATIWRSFTRMFRMTSAVKPLSLT